MTATTITETAAPMRLRAAPRRVTRLSRKMLAGVGAVTLLGIGGALIYALQTGDGGPGDEFHSTGNRPKADGFQITVRVEFNRLIDTNPDTLTDLEGAARFLDLQRTAFGGRVSGAISGYRWPGRRGSASPRWNRCRRICTAASPAW